MAPNETPGCDIEKGKKLVDTLAGNGKSGKEIAEKLYSEGYSIRMSMFLLEYAGFKTELERGNPEGVAVAQKAHLPEPLRECDIARVRWVNTAELSPANMPTV